MRLFLTLTTLAWLATACAVKSPAPNTGNLESEREGTPGGAISQVRNEPDVVVFAGAEQSSAPPAGTTRFIVGGDARDDFFRVVPWSFQEAKARRVSAYIFLGDMELTPGVDSLFKKELTHLAPVPFYPILGNHEVLRFGVLKLLPAQAEKKFRQRFLSTKLTPVKSTFKDHVAYSTLLPGGLHVLAVDNVSQKGFGEDQLAWMESDLKAAHDDPETKHIIVCMHKALAKNGVTTHAMDEDGAKAIRDSDTALALFKKYGVSTIFASHDHGYAKLIQDGIETHITGGLGAPLSNKLKNPFHHFLQLDVTDRAVAVTVVKFPKGAHMAKDEGDGDTD